MKKFLTALLTAILSVTLLFSFGCKDQPEEGSLSVYAPDGAPALSIAKFINDNEDFGTGATMDYNVISASNIGPTMVQGKGDIIVMPVNAASKLYKSNASDPYKMVSVVTHGNLYIMGQAISSLEDLKGTVIGVIGNGLVPDLTFRAVLKDKGIAYEEGATAVSGKVVIKYFDDASTLMPQLKTGALMVGLLPEPAATTLVSTTPNKTFYRIDLQHLYDSENAIYPQAVMMVKSSVLNKYPNLVSEIASKFDNGVAWVKSNTATAVAKINETLPDGVTPSLKANLITSTVVDNCKIFWQSSANAKLDVQTYINKLISLESVSAEAVSDDFFM